MLKVQLTLRKLLGERCRQSDPILIHSFHSSITSTDRFFSSGLSILVQNNNQVTFVDLVSDSDLYLFNGTGGRR